jgi:hypothetical protein
MASVKEKARYVLWVAEKKKCVTGGAHVEVVH